MTAEEIAWTLTANPKVGRLAWDVVARCPHGRTDHYIFGRASLVLDQAAGLALIHQMATGCGCPTGDVSLKGATDASAP